MSNQKTKFDLISLGDSVKIWSSLTQRIPVPTNGLTARSNCFIQSVQFNKQTSPMELQPVRGTRDFFPDQMRLRNWLFDIFKQVSLAFGFEEYDACVLEHEDLYIRKAGDEITQQLYSFEDKSGRKLSLRPEMTPSLARMVLQQQKTLTYPLKWYTIAQCFRYERMTKGRKREHYQWNADIIGQEGAIAEAEALTLILTACQQMGLGRDEIRLFINDRRILNQLLERLGVPETIQLKVLIVLDKRDKLKPEVFSDLLKEEGLNPEQIQQVNEFLALQSLQEVEEKLEDSAVLQPLKEILRLVEEAGFAGFVQFDASIVRGLSYYTGPVFEVNTPDKNSRAICGGGRYDSLLSTYGGESVPAVGFGFGDVVIVDLLNELNKLPKLASSAEVAILPFSQEQFGTAMKLASALRNQGRTVTCNFGQKKMKKMLQQADDNGATWAVLLFPDELEQGNAAVKNMHDKQQNTLSLEQIMNNQLP